MQISCIFFAYLHKIALVMQIRQVTNPTISFTSGDLSKVAAQCPGRRANKIMTDKLKGNLWGGRFKGAADPGFVEFNQSFNFDRRLFEVDVRASIAHCEGLTAGGVLTANDSEQIRSALTTILERGRSDAGYFDEAAAEDVHSFVEARLVEMLGDTGRKLHTGRSRNDQVATDLRLWLREEIDRTTDALRRTQQALLDLAEANRAAVMPGYTHLQRAQ